MRHERYTTRKERTNPDRYAVIDTEAPQGACARVAAGLTYQQAQDEAARRTLREWLTSARKAAA